MKKKKYVKPEIETFTYDVDSGFLLPESITIEGVPGYNNGLGVKFDMYDEEE